MRNGNRIPRYLIPVLLFLIIVAISANLIVNRETVIPPRIVPQQTNDTVPAPEYTFPFQSGKVTLTSPVDPAVYVGAKTADKETGVRGNVSEEIWLKETYLAMVNDPAQDVFYLDLVTALRTIRNRQHLSDDEYLELITVFVQSIPYETTSQNPPKFPVETYTEKSGDCDDKSLLLAGLLSREGYNVSLLSFAPESHMAVGVVCPGGEYRQTGYAFIETTNFSFPGVPSRILGTGIFLQSNPQVIRIGNGTITYKSCNESLYLDSVVALSEQRVELLTGEIDEMRTKMDRYYSEHDIRNYNELVPVFNNLQQDRMKYAELHNYIINHRYDRKGTIPYVKTTMTP